MEPHLVTPPRPIGRGWLIAGLIAAVAAVLWATRYESLGCVPPGACVLRNRWTGTTVIAVPEGRL